MTKEAMKEQRLFVDGDIYFWKWKSVKDRFMPYHCYSCKAVVKGGALYDTYWTSPTDRGCLNLDKIEIEFKGNMHAMQTIPDYDAKYYRDEDVVQMAHSNSTKAPVYLKPGAKRNAEVMKAHIEYEIERAVSTIRMARDRKESLEAALLDIEIGNLEKVYL